MEPGAAPPSRVERLLWALAQIGPEGGPPLDRSGLCARLAQQAAAALEAPAVGLWLADPEGQLRLEASLGLPEEAAGIDWAPDGLLGWVVRQRATVRAPALARDERLSDQERSWWVEQQGFGLLLGAPLTTASAALGVLGALYFAPREVGEEQIQVLQALAAQGAVAVQNVQLYEAQVRRNLELSTLAEIGRALASTRDTGRLIQRVLSVATDLTGAERGLLFLLSSDRQRLGLGAARGLSRATVKDFPAIPMGEGVVGWVAQQGDPLILADAASDARFRDWGLGSTFAVLAVPLKTRERVLGVLELQNKLVRERFSEDDLGLLMALAGQAAIALDNAELYENLERRVEEAHQEMVVAHRALQQTNREIETIMQSMADGLVVTDPQGRVRMLNPAAAALLALPEDPLGQPLEAMVPHQQIREGLRQVRERGEPVELEMTLDAHHARSLKLHVNPLCHQAGEPWGLVWVLNDITSLRELDRIKTELLSFVSHELRTPLSAVKGFAATLRQRRGQLTPEIEEEILETIEGEIDRLTRLTLDLLDISRIESGRALELECSRVELKTLVERVFQTQTDFADTHRFTMNISPQAERIWADEDKLEQILLNLVNNAAKYSPEGGNVEVVAKGEGRQWAITVRDEGIGIPSEALPLLFERYRRVGPDRTIRGVGIGLYLVKHLVEAHGGRVWVESEEGGGSTFGFTIPQPEGSPRETDSSPVGDLGGQRGGRRAGPRSAPP